MVHFQKGLARLTLSARAASGAIVGGSILVQTFSLANGSLCLKASLNWNASSARSAIAVYPTPTLNWKVEASRIASAWLQGPPANGTTSATESAASEAPALIAAAG